MGGKECKIAEDLFALQNRSDLLQAERPWRKQTAEKYNFHSSVCINYISLKAVAIKAAADDN